MDRDKKSLRKLKREIKRSGNKRRRSVLKRQLQENPEEAGLLDEDELLGGHRSATLNGLDHDDTRQDYRRNLEAAKSKHEYAVRSRLLFPDSDENQE